MARGRVGEHGELPGSQSGPLLQHACFEEEGRSQHHHAQQPQRQQRPKQTQCASPQLSPRLGPRLVRRHSPRLRRPAHCQHGQHPVPTVSAPSRIAVQAGGFMAPQGPVHVSISPASDCTDDPVAPESPRSRCIRPRAERPDSHELSRATMRSADTVRTAASRPPASRDSADTPRHRIADHAAGAFGVRSPETDAVNPSGSRARPSLPPASSAVSPGRGLGAPERVWSLRACVRGDVERVPRAAGPVRPRGHMSPYPCPASAPPRLSAGAASARRLQFPEEEGRSQHRIIIARWSSPSASTRHP